MVDFPHAVLDQPTPPAPNPTLTRLQQTFPQASGMAPFDIPAPQPAMPGAPTSVPQMGHPGLQGLANMFAPIGQRALASMGGQAQSSGFQQTPLY